MVSLQFSSNVNNKLNLSEYITPGAFGYHFSAPTGAKYNPNYYNYRDKVSEPVISDEPIVYDFYPPKPDDSSEANWVKSPLDYFVVGVENMALIGEFKEDQHLVVFVAQERDGLAPREYGDDDFDDVEQYFPDAEFVHFSSEAEPTSEEMRAIGRRIRQYIDEGKC